MDREQKSKAASGVLATSYAYKPEVKDFGDLAFQLNIDIPELLHSESVERTNSDKFRASAILDRKNKKILYAIAGTRLGQGKSTAQVDIKDDIKLALGMNPSKIKSIREFNKFLLDSIEEAALDKYEKKNSGKACSIEEREALIREEMKGYEIDFTGHSLGAVLADCAAADMHMQIKERGINKADVALSSTTFDNPGALNPVEKICKKNSVAMEELTSSVKYKVFNNRDNFINTLDKQVGEKYQILPDGQKPRGSFALMCGWIAKKMPLKYAKGLFKQLSFGKLSIQAKDHSLSNFNEVLVQGKGVVKAKGGKIMTIQEATTGIELIEYDKEVFDNIKSTSSKASSKGGGEFSMIDPEDKDNRIEFSMRQLKEATKDRQILSDVHSKPKSGLKRFADKFMSKISRSKKQSNVSKYAYSQNYQKRSVDKVLLQNKGKAI